jgi:hypothetical protein
MSFIDHLTQILNAENFYRFITLFEEVKANILDNSSFKFADTSFLVFLDNLKEIISDEGICFLLQFVVEHMKILYKKLLNVNLHFINSNTLFQKYEDMISNQNLKQAEKVYSEEFLKEDIKEMIPDCNFILDHYKTHSNIFSENTVKSLSHSDIQKNFKQVKCEKHP